MLCDGSSKARTYVRTNGLTNASKTHTKIVTFLTVREEQFEVSA